MEEVKIVYVQTKGGRGTKVVKAAVMAGLSLCFVGVLLFSFLIYKHHKSAIEAAGFILFEVGIMFTSLMLVGIAIYGEGYDTTLRFGFVLMSSVLLAFLMLMIL